MGQILHGSARTTAAVRRAIQHSQESLRALAGRHGINQKTVAKWKNRTSATDLPTGPKEPRSTVLSVEDEAIIVAFRRHTLLPLDDCLYALQPTIPHLTRSSLHRCLARHGISRLPEVEGDKPAKKRFKAYPIGYLHIDIAEVQTTEGKLYLYVAIDRTSKFTVVQLVKKTGRTSASAFLERVIEAIPYKIHTVLTDNGIQFTFPPRYADGPTARYMTHMFDMRCRENGIEHRLTKVKHPWTNGQVERMNRTIKEATVKRYHYDSHQQLEAHLAVFIDAYNYGRPLKTLKGLTPYEFICKMWTKEPERFRLNPIHQSPGLNTMALVGPRAVFAHGVHLADEELRRLHESGAAIAHCPSSNLFLGSGLFRMEAATAAHRPVRLGLGSDIGGGTSFSLLRTAGEAYKVGQLTGRGLTAAQGLHLMTLGPAQALGLDGVLGSLAAGYEADIVVLDPEATPLLHFRNARSRSVAETLFVLMTVADDRAVAAAYLGGRLTHARAKRQDAGAAHPGSGSRS
jgi:transposase-like protein